MFEFTKATKIKSKARIALIGPSGSGKTYTALKIANGLGGNIAVIDTEHGSASKYASNFEFSTLELDQFSPELYIQAIRAAEKAGFDVLIIDSLSHEWNGKGGALEMVDNVTKRIKSHNSFMAWGEVTPLHNQLIDTIVGCNCHVIATMRSKTEYVIETVNGKNVPRKIGMAAVQRDGMEYEYDIVGDLDHDHNLIITKTRFVEIDGQVISKPDEALGETIKAWLTDGDEPPAKLPHPDPSQWLPDLQEFSARATEDFGIAWVELKVILKDKCGFTGFKSENASEMYNCLAKYFASDDNRPHEDERQSIDIDDI